MIYLNPLYRYIAKDNPIISSFSINIRQMNVDLQRNSPLCGKNPVWKTIESTFHYE